MSDATSVISPVDRLKHITSRLPETGLFAEKSWRIPPAPLALSTTHVQLLEKLGLVLHHFNQACNNLYRQSASGKIHPWVAQLLDYGKPPELVAIARHEKTKGHLPAVIRPDLILTDEGFAMSELDSVPGGIGLTAWLNETYSELGDPVLGGANGMRQGFLSILKEGRVLISEEAGMYRPEMEWLIGKERVLSVEDYVPASPEPLPDYRFFEAFDYPQLTKFQQAWQPGMPLTPPLKPFMEEKLWLALFWSRPLQDFWRQEIGENGQRLLQKIIPYSWVMDPTPLPPHAVIPELAIQAWSEMEKFSQKQRELVLKISGFSPLAWGSKSVYVGSDLSAAEWSEQVRIALSEFTEHPRILMRFAKGALAEQSYAAEEGEIRTLRGRARICPYYFVVQDRVTLGGVLSTLCPADKKLLHGMTDAVIGPVMGTPSSGFLK